MRTALNAAMTLAATMAGVAAYGQTAPDPSQVFIRSINYAGSGCRAGSVAQNLSPDAKAVTLLFDSYVAETGPGVSPASTRKNCQVLLDLQYPNGWTYTVVSVDYRGFAALDPDVTGTQSATYYFQGSGRSIPLQTTLRGPTSQDYQVRDQLGVTSLVWAPCGASRALNINTAVAVSSPRRDARGLMTIDSIDAGMKQVYGIQWQRCGIAPPPPPPPPPPPAGLKFLNMTFRPLNATQWVADAVLQHTGGAPVTLTSIDLSAGGSVGAFTGGTCLAGAFNTSGTLIYNPAKTLFAGQSCTMQIVWRCTEPGPVFGEGIQAIAAGHQVAAAPITMQCR